MRILILTAAYPPEIRSASHLMAELAQGLAERKHEVAVVTPAPAYNLADGAPRSKRRLIMVSVESKVKVARVWTARFQMVGPVARGLAQLTLPFAVAAGGMWTGAADVILVYSPPLTMAVGALFLGRLKGAPYVLNVQDLFPQNAIDLGVLRGRLPIGFYRSMESRVYKRAAAITVHSEGNCRVVRAGVANPSRVTVVRNWVDLESYRTAGNGASFRSRHELEGVFLVLFAGVMGYAQDLDTVLEAARRLKSNREIVFLLVGDGVEKAALMRKAQAAGIGNVRFMNWVSQEAYPELVAAVDVGLVTLRKSMKTPVVPSKLLGYMAAGKPVVSSLNSESDAIPIIDESGCGFNVDVESPDAMAEAIEKLWKSPESARGMGERGRAYALAHFSRTRAVDDYEWILRNCANQRWRET